MKPDLVFVGRLTMRVEIENRTFAAQLFDSGTVTP